MPSVNCFRRVLLNVGGKKIIISVPNGMTETEVNKVMVVTRAYLQKLFDDMERRANKTFLNLGRRLSPPSRGRRVKRLDPGFRNLTNIFLNGQRFRSFV